MKMFDDDEDIGCYLLVIAHSNQQPANYLR